MPTTTVVHLLRHGEVHNPDGVLYGRLPGFRLSELGHEMAIAVAEHLEAHDIVRVIASPLERAIETAAPIADSHELGIHVDPRLIEAGNFFEGKRVGVGDGALRQPRYWGRLVDPFTPSWGERYQGIAARMTAAIDDIRRDVRGHEAVEPSAAVRGGKVLQLTGVSQPTVEDRRDRGNHLRHPSKGSEQPHRGGLERPGAGQARDAVSGERALQATTVALGQTRLVGVEPLLGELERLRALPALGDRRLLRGGRRLRRGRRAR